MVAASYLITLLAGYFLGSIPTGYLVARARGVDIRSVGSGNIGATNVFRILGKPAGVFVLLADGLKGFLPVALILNWYGELCDWAPGIFRLDGIPNDALRLNLGIVAGVAAILGHNYTCWLRFKGGKGVATTSGVLLALFEWPVLALTLGVWLVTFAVTRYVSVASIIAAFGLPFIAWLLGAAGQMIGIAAAMGALAIFKHRANIQRLMNGTENRFGRKATADKPAKPSSTSTDERGDFKQ